jgi:putative membrane protein
MLSSWLIASLHVLALGLGVWGIWTRARALGKLPQPTALREVFYADNFWGIAAIIWISTGLMRAFGTGDKGPSYYLESDAFWLKMGLLMVVLALEVWPMATLIGWRIAQARGQTLNLSPAPTFALISWVQLVLTLVMVLVAVAVTRGLGV